MESSSPSGPSKRARGVQTVACVVDGCTEDLNKCKNYHRRHRVCELHSKAPKVTVRGQEQRFCQQCSRFHSLVEFDEVKRSCRKRLMGHNRRRRKPQLEAASFNFFETFVSDNQGTKYLSFGGSHVSGTGGSSLELNFIHSQDSASLAAVDPGCSSGGPDQPRRYEGLHQVGSSHALSLLSSETETRGIGTQPQAFTHELNYEQPSLLVSDGSGICQGMPEFGLHLCELCSSDACSAWVQP